MKGTGINHVSTRSKEAGAITRDDILVLKKTLRSPAERNGAGARR